MIRALTTVGAVAALAVSAAPVASAGTPEKPPLQMLELCDYDGSTVVTHKPKPRCGAGKAANLGAADDVITRKARPSRAVVVLIGANDYGLVARRP